MADLRKVPRSCCPGSAAGGPFRIGDRVHLNSGGILLTVVDISKTRITVAWRDKRGRVYEWDFPPACLHLVQ